MTACKFRKAARLGVVCILLIVGVGTWAQIAQTNAGDVKDWYKLDAGPFSILAPSGWEFHQLTGVDSYVGEFVGKGMKLTFDFGRYSTELRHAKKPAYIITKKSLDGRTAKVVSPRTPGNGTVGVFVRLDRHHALCLWGQNLSIEKQRLAFKMFETLRFGGPMPPYIISPPPPSLAHRD
jgi:hypothetical protein